MIDTARALMQDMSSAVLNGQADNQPRGKRADSGQVLAGH